MTPSGWRNRRQTARALGTARTVATAEGLAHGAYAGAVSEGQAHLSDAGSGLLIARHPDVLWRRSLGCVIALPPNQDTVITLMAPGDTIWQMMERPRSIDDLASELLTTFAADADDILRDVETFVSSLVDAGLATRHERVRT